MQLPKLITAREVTEVADLDIQAVYRLARENVFPAGTVVRFGRHVRFHPAKLQEFIESGGAGLPRKGAA
jgi:predicted DNA-binding transcriptional regulator AlpA